MQCLRGGERLGDEPDAGLRRGGLGLGLSLTGRRGGLGLGLCLPACCGLRGGEELGLDLLPWRGGLELELSLFTPREGLGPGVSL